MPNAASGAVKPNAPESRADDPLDAQQPAASIGVSVVVPTRGRPAVLARCLEALAAQRLHPRHFEVVVVDDAASARARAIVERFTETEHLQVHYLEAHGARRRASARNVGWRAARGEIVAFTEDHCVPDPGWLIAGLAAFRSGVQGVEGRVAPQTRYPKDQETNAGPLARGDFVTANCFYRRDALAWIGGFDERFQAPWMQGRDLFFTLLERGGVCARAEGAVVVRPIPPATWEASIGAERANSSKALLYKKHPSLYRESIEPRPPWTTYATTLALVTAVASAARGRPRPARAAGAAWLALSARLCARGLAGTEWTPSRVAQTIVTSALLPPLTACWRLQGALRHRVPFI
jgi:hypothetical protein